MKEISLHILDIVQNSISAGSTLIKITVLEDREYLSFTVTDNGRGMSPELVAAVEDPFTTGRTERKVGLGIPLLKQAAMQTGGGISIKSREGEGTEICARFGFGHIDRQPLGDMAQTMLLLITSNAGIDFVYEHRIVDKSFSLDTRQIKETLGDVPVTEPSVTRWLFEYLQEGEQSLEQGL